MNEPLLQDSRMSYIMNDYSQVSLSMKERELMQMTDEEVLEWLDKNTRIGVILTDKDLNIISINDWIEYHTNKKKYNIAGKTIFEIFPEVMENNKYYIYALNGNSYMLDSLSGGYLIRIPLKNKTCNRDVMKQFIHILPFFKKGKIEGTITLVEDISCS